MKIKLNYLFLQRIIAICLLTGLFLFLVEYFTIDDNHQCNIAEDLITEGIFSCNFNPDDPLLAERKILVTTAINEKTTKEVIYKLIYLDNLVSDKPIDLLLRTVGGWRDDAFAIIDVINSLKSPVNTYALGGCSSSGCMILASGTGTRYAFPNSSIMVHANFNSVTNKFFDGKLQRERAIKFWNKNAELPKEWFPFTQDKEYYLTPEEALEFKIIDKIKVAKNEKN